ncbi:hypothetical protein HMPREF6485_0194 [Segatella buccae ATCC 33574]|uniref:Uncharacterized protein n=1 Tax=Segatella buccae ATCC 33574 TaxID=873513 RepID=E6K3P1_9BACT|nr:hypothetical protein HMPREF6485_0194 [Segatella buccae ATCC 33574]
MWGEWVGRRNDPLGARAADAVKMLHIIEHSLVALAVVAVNSTQAVSRGYGVHRRALAWEAKCQKQQECELDQESLRR